MYLLTEVLKESLPELRSSRLRPVSVAVIDSGIDSSHELLRNKVDGAWAFTEQNGEVVTTELPLKSNNDTAGHGTAVAGIIAKIAPNVRILDYKVLNQKFGGTGREMLAGFKAAVEGEAKIINMSLACLAKYKSEMEELCELAYQKHKIVIASKRNVPKPGDLGFPAELSSCISVENNFYGNNPYFIEHIDEQPIEFAAHGENVLVARNGGGYYRLTGTSFATPTVSGNAALLLGRYPDLELFELKSIFKYHSRKNTFRTPGIINPLEIAEKQASGTGGTSSYLCPECGFPSTVHEAFTFIKCPCCEKVFAPFAGLDKKLYKEVMYKLTFFLPEALEYHNKIHTMEVVANTSAFMTHYSNISRMERKCLLTAALFHDCGYTERYTDNEAAAAEYAGEILPGYGYSGKEIALVQSLIMATAMPQHPVNRLEKILCDADMGHIGTSRYRHKSLLLRKERKNYGFAATTQQYLQGEIEFLARHRFYQKWLEQRRADLRKMDIVLMQKDLAKISRKADNSVRKSSGGAQIITETEN